MKKLAPLCLALALLAGPAFAQQPWPLVPQWQHPEWREQYRHREHWREERWRRDEERREWCRYHPRECRF